MAHIYRHKYDRSQPLPCPVCELGGGFHDVTVHKALIIPRELIKPKDWHKQ